MIVGAVPSPALTSLAAAVLRLPSTPERILEIGCEEGDRVLFLAREFPSARVRGIDQSEQAVRDAVARVGLDPEGRVAFKRGTSRSLPFPDDLFDLVAQVGGRPHAREVARVLHPGGHLILVGDSRLPRRIRRRGLEPIETGEVGGAPFLLARLNDAD